MHPLRKLRESGKPTPAQIAADAAMMAFPSAALIYLTHYGNGSATPMRGKSATCRRRTFFFIRVFDPPRSKTVQINGPPLGKSETCRASEWQSHCSGRI